MRLTVYAALGAMLAVQPALAQGHCAGQTERTMFDVEALKSQLMVLATSCHQSTEYNAFVGRYKSDLAGFDHALEAYFKRTYGRSADREHDAFITNLANAQSTNGLRQGTDFCPRNDQLFHEVMALDSVSDLPTYAAGKDLVPDTLNTCAAPASPAAARSAAPHKRGKS